MIITSAAKKYALTVNKFIHFLNLNHYRIKFTIKVWESDKLNFFEQFIKSITSMIFQSTEPSCMFY